MFWLEKFVSAANVQRYNLKMVCQIDLIGRRELSHLIGVDSDHCIALLWIVNTGVGQGSLIVARIQCRRQQHLKSAIFTTLLHFQDKRNHKFGF